MKFTAPPASLTGFLGASRLPYHISSASLKKGNARYLHLDGCQKYIFDTLMSSINLLNLIYPFSSTDFSSLDMDYLKYQYFRYTIWSIFAWGNRALYKKFALWVGGQILKWNFSNVYPPSAPPWLGPKARKFCIFSTLKCLKLHFWEVKSSIKHRFYRSKE